MYVSCTHLVYMQYAHTYNDVRTYSYVYVPTELLRKICMTFRKCVMNVHEQFMNVHNALFVNLIIYVH